MEREQNKCRDKAMAQGPDLGIGRHGLHGIVNYYNLDLSATQRSDPRHQEIWDLYDFGKVLNEFPRQISN